MGKHGKYRPLVGTGVVAAAAVLAAPALAACRLALALGLDVSSSVDATEDALQRGGLASALIAPEVQAAFFAAPMPVALAVFEWSGRDAQNLLLDWKLIHDRGDLLTAAETVGRSQRGSDDWPTAVGHALGYGAGLLQRAPECLFRTLDLSGDGENNDGFPPASAYRAYPFAGVTVNGLVINAAEFEAEITLIDFYRREVLHGPGAFLEVANGFPDFERAMRRKLERELSAAAIGSLVPAMPGAPG